jgi:hypothetical protein
MDGVRFAVSDRPAMTVRMMDPIRRRRVARGGGERGRLLAGGADITHPANGPVHVHDQGSEAHP